MPERARQRRREAARKRNRRILAGAGVLTLLGVAAGRFGEVKGRPSRTSPGRRRAQRRLGGRSGSDAGPAPRRPG